MQKEQRLGPFGPAADIRKGFLAEKVTIIGFYIFRSKINLLLVSTFISSKIFASTLMWSTIPGCTNTFLYKHFLIGRITPTRAPWKVRKRIALVKMENYTI